MSGYITAEGLVVPVGSDTYDYVNDQRRLASSIRSIVSAADNTAVTSILNGMTSDGRTASDTNPLFTWNVAGKGLQFVGTAGTIMPASPAAPFGHMGRTAGFQSINTTTGGANGAIVGMSAAQVLKNGMTFDSSNSALVVPVGGLYLVNTKGYFSGGTGGWQGIARPVLNNQYNTLLGPGVQAWKADSNDYFYGGMGIMQLNAGDKVNLISYGGVSGANTWGTDGNNGTYLELMFVGQV